MAKPFPAYRGDEPYVFVCYAHDDSDVVYPEIQWLYDEGTHLWYDEGIEGGEVWRAELASAIEDAAALIYFVSPKSVASNHCRQEINYALDRGLKIVPLYLEKTELPPDLRIGLTSVQALFRETDSDYRQHLLRALSKPTSPVAAGRGAMHRKRSSFLYASLTVLAALVAGGGLWYTVSDQPMAPAAAASVAILPLLDVGVDAVDAHLGQALAAEVIGQLTSSEVRSKFGGFGTLKDRFFVAPMAASNKDWTDITPAVIGQQLNVAYLVDGTARRTNTHARVGARLARLSDGYQVFSTTIQRPLSMGAEAELEIARIISLEVVNAIAADQFTEMLRSRFGEAPWFDLFFEASRNYFEGAVMGSRSDHRLIAEQMERAVELGMPFAIAKRQIISAEASRRGRTLTPEEATAQLEAHAKTLAEIGANDALSADHVRSLVALYFRLDYAAAERHALANLARFPDFAASHTIMAGVLQRQGRTADAVQRLQRAVDAGAFSPGLVLEYARMLIAHGNDRVALQQVNNGLNFFTRPYARGRWVALKTTLLDRLGRRGEALKTLDEGLEIYGGVVPQYFAYPLAVLGRAAEAREILATMLPDADTDRVSNYLIFETYAALGEFDKAFDWLERSLESRDFETVQWLHAPRLWGALTGHPRMQEIQDSLRALEGAPTPGGIDR